MHFVVFSFNIMDNIKEKKCMKRLRGKNCRSLVIQQKVWGTAVVPSRSRNFSSAPSRTIVLKHQSHRTALSHGGSQIRTQFFQRVGSSLGLNTQSKFPLIYIANNFLRKKKYILSNITNKISIFQIVLPFF